MQHKNAIKCMECLIATYENLHFWFCTKSVARHLLNFLFKFLHQWNHTKDEFKGMRSRKKIRLTFFKCLFAHLVKVFFWMASLSSEIKRKVQKWLYKNLKYFHKRSQMKKQVSNVYLIERFKILILSNIFYAGH